MVLKQRSKRLFHFFYMTLILMEGPSFKQNLKVPDDRGGGVMFAAFLKSIYSITKTSIVDICDAKLHN